ncbi:MAG: ferredoxin, partial [Kiritimatiellae bacterium]|nr:ferredoxin [Kiritimatiellia bacterium]
VACGRCISRCPTGALRTSVRLASFGQPEMFFQNGFCRMACGSKCAAACPVGALVPRARANRRNLHFGLAVVAKDLCVRATDGVACKACARKCPLGAITIKDGFPVVDDKVCVGCGACEHVCAARPEPAIRVEGLDRPWEFSAT